MTSRPDPWATADRSPRRCTGGRAAAAWAESTVLRATIVEAVHRQKLRERSPDAGVVVHDENQRAARSTAREGIRPPQSSIAKIARFQMLRDVRRWREACEASWALAFQFWRFWQFWQCPYRADHSMRSRGGEVRGLLLARYVSEPSPQPCCTRARQGGLKTRRSRRIMASSDLCRPGCMNARSQSCRHRFKWPGRMTTGRRARARTTICRYCRQLCGTMPLLRTGPAPSAAAPLICAHCRRRRTLLTGTALFAETSLATSADDETFAGIDQDVTGFGGFSSDPSSGLPTIGGEGLTTASKQARVCVWHAHHRRRQRPGLTPRLAPRRPPTDRRRARLREPLPHHPAARRRRHGRRLSGVGPGARRRRRPQGHSAGGRADPGSRADARAAVQAGAAARPPGHAQERRPHPRSRRDRRHQVHHDAVHRGRGPCDHPEARRQAPGATRSEDRARRWPPGSPRRTRRASCIAT